LDQTCFYPEGGGQPSDKGLIDSQKVTYVYEKDGTIFHVLERKPMKLHRVKCSIDWENRLDHMQQHCGQHILSACFLEQLNAGTIGFHLGDKYSTIDIDKPLSDSDTINAETAPNKTISDNVPVEILLPSYSELKKMNLRKVPPKTDEQIRIVKIGDMDTSACCGTHPKSTIEVQLIKITGWEKYKSGTRVEFICGKRAVSDYARKNDEIRKMAGLLSCSEVDLLPFVERLTSELREALSEKRALKSEIMQYEVKDILNSCESINNIKIVKTIYENTDLKYVDSLAAKLSANPNTIVLFGVKNNDRAQLIFMRSRDLNIISMNNLLKDAITLIDGKGGGSEFSAQGGGKNNNNLDSTLEYAYNKIKNLF
jgi:alanyl-tRNA synthetase